MARLTTHGAMRSSGVSPATMVWIPPSSERHGNFQALPPGGPMLRVIRVGSADSSMNTGRRGSLRMKGIRRVNPSWRAALTLDHRLQARYRSL